MLDHQNFHLCALHQIYKMEDGDYLPVAEILDDVSRQFHDPFLDEMKVKTWRKSGRYFIIKNLENVSFQ